MCFNARWKEELNTADEISLHTKEQQRTEEDGKICTYSSQSNPQETNAIKEWSAGIYKVLKSLDTF